jgi:hypothetical protein
MGKSLRNKAQTKSRRLKRSESWYGQHDTDRIQRLSDRLLKRKVEQDGPEGVKAEEVKKNEDGDEIVIEDGEDQAIKVEDEGEQDDHRHAPLFPRGTPRLTLIYCYFPLCSLFASTTRYGRHGHPQEDLHLGRPNVPSRRMASLQGHADQGRTKGEEQAGRGEGEEEEWKAG